MFSELDPLEVYVGSMGLGAVQWDAGDVGMIVYLHISRCTGVLRDFQLPGPIEHPPGPIEPSTYTSTTRWRRRRAAWWGGAILTLA